MGLRSLMRAYAPLFVKSRVAMYHNFGVSAARIIFGGLVIAFIPQKIHAAQVTFTITGTVSGGLDGLGIFAPPGTFFAGKNYPFTLVLTFDDAKGVHSVQTCALNGQPDGSTIQSTAASNPGTASLTINGFSYAFGQPNPTFAVASSMSRFAGFLCGSGPISFGDSVITFSVSSSLGSINTFTSGSVYPATGTTLSPDYSWEAAFSNSNLNQSTAIAFDIILPPGATDGQLIPSSITVSSSPGQPAADSFPAGLVPFTSIYKVSGPDANGNFLVVGSMNSVSAYTQIANVPPVAAGSKFSDGTIQLAPGAYYSNVYVPTASERAGNFSDTTLALTDPQTGLPFPGNIIPASRLGGVYAFLIGPPVPSSGALNFIPTSPCRIADTRNPAGPLGAPFLAGNSTRSFNVPSSPCNIPATASAYSLNITVVPHGGLSYLSVWPTGQNQPVVSTLNSDGRVKANAAITPAGANGAISVFATDDTDLILDINGYFVDASTTNSLAFFPLTPCRITDTRSPAGDLNGPSLVGTQTRTFPILASPCNLPPSAQAYSMNMTAVPPSGFGLSFLSTWPAGQSQPTVSTLNASTGQVTANAAIVPAGTSGAIAVYASNNTDLVIDTNGYFAPATAGGLHYYTVPPCRVFDTRERATGQPFSGTVQVPVYLIQNAGSLCNVVQNAAAVAVNVTVVPESSLGYLTLWPYGTTQPGVSTLNANDAVITSNMAIVPVSSGALSAYASSQTHVIVDILGFFAP